MLRPAVAGLFSENPQYLIQVRGFVKALFSLTILLVFDILGSRSICCLALFVPILTQDYKELNGSQPDYILSRTYY